MEKCHRMPKSRKVVSFTPQPCHLSLSINPSYNEKALLIKISQGDGNAFRELLSKHHLMCYRAAFKLTQDQDLAEDIVQDAFLKVWLRRNQLPEIENFGGWLRTVVMNLLYDHIRQRKSEKLQLSKWLSDGGNPENRQEEPSQQENYFLELVSQAVDRLPSKQKQTFNLLKKEGYSREEAANLMGVSTETVKTNMERALKSIRAYCIGKLDATSILVIFGMILKKYF